MTTIHSPLIGDTELSLDEMNAVAGGAKGDSGGLDAAKKIDISSLLKELDKALGMLHKI